MALCIAVQGFLVYREHIPDAMIWLHYMSMYKYSWEGLLTNELEGMPLLSLPSYHSHLLLLIAGQTFICAKHTLIEFIGRWDKNLTVWMCNQKVTGLSLSSSLSLSPYLSSLSNNNKIGETYLEYLGINQTKWESLGITIVFMVGFQIIHFLATYFIKWQRK